MASAKLQPKPRRPLIEGRRRLLTTAEAREVLGCSDELIRRLWVEGRLKRLKLGRSVRWTADSIERLIGA